MNTQIIKTHISTVRFLHNQWLLKAMVFYFHDHAISSLTHQKDMNIALTTVVEGCNAPSAYYKYRYTLLSTLFNMTSAPADLHCWQYLSRGQAPSFTHQSHWTYAKCESLADTCNVFNCMTEQDISSWTLDNFRLPKTWLSLIGIDTFSPNAANSNSSPTRLIHLSHHPQSMCKIGRFATGFMHTSTTL